MTGKPFSLFGISSMSATTDTSAALPTISSESPSPGETRDSNPFGKHVSFPQSLSLNSLREVTPPISSEMEVKFRQFTTLNLSSATRFYIGKYENSQLQIVNFFSDTFFPSNSSTNNCSSEPLTESISREVRVISLARVVLPWPGIPTIEMTGKPFSLFGVSSMSATIDTSASLPTIFSESPTPGSFEPSTTTRESRRSDAVSGEPVTGRRPPTVPRVPRRADALEEPDRTSLPPQSRPRRLTPAKHKSAMTTTSPRHSTRSHDGWRRTKSARAKPLHWTSCLKIAEDVAQGLSYIHQAWRLVHGNLKSSNVLLGSDFEACLTDYCLSVFANLSNDDDPNSAAYKAPEIRKLNHQATATLPEQADHVASTEDDTRD
ncbi:hypothetical protein RJ640_020190 [Escallonia rubra]|uniref:Protein kinase domain-containing protein n=1 Tax=Escallonia rubra TaxID=112253 RepID=A0AA88R0X2_9ASTE|nr:hypothetical protein RJ640_020190 [Escallonia rubra]